jgi:hypothetical protein
MDVNLTGTLITTSESDYIPLLTQLVIGIVTVGGTLGGALLIQKHSDRMHAKEEKEKWLEARKIAYIDFLDVFSKPMTSRNQAVLVDLIGTYIKAAINVNKYGEVRLSEHVNIEDSVYSVLSDKGEYVFSWENDKEIRYFLTHNFGFNWIDTGKIERIENSMTIEDSAGDYHILIEIDNKKREVILKINDLICNTYKLITKVENNKLNVYNVSGIFKEFEQNKVYDLEIQSLTDIIKELLEIRYTIHREGQYTRTDLIRQICIKNFGQAFLEGLIEHR